MPIQAFALQPGNPELHCQPEEIDFVDWVFNAAPVLKERAEMMALHEEMTYKQDAEMRTSCASVIGFHPPYHGHAVEQDGEEGQKSLGRRLLASGRGNEASQTPTLVESRPPPT